jgi:Tfp pilus assembly protein PilN
MHDFVKIDMHENLIRDISTRAVLQDSSKIKEYKQRKEFLQSSEANLQKQKEDIDEIRAEMREIKQMILNLMQR